MAGSKVEIYEKNHKMAKTKALLWSISVGFLAVGSGLSVCTTITERLRAGGEWPSDRSVRGNAL